MGKKLDEILERIKIIKDLIEAAEYEENWNFDDAISRGNNLIAELENEAAREAIKLSNEVE